MTAQVRTRVPCRDPRDPPLKVRHKPIGPWLARPLNDWGYASEAYLLLGIFRIITLIGPLRLFSPLLGTPNQQTPLVLVAEAAPIIQRVAWALLAAAARTPWRSTCLVQALAGRLMLHRRGISSTLTLGLEPSHAPNRHAHAWLRSGEQMVSGGLERASFTAVASFADRPRGSQ